MRRVREQGRTFCLALLVLTTLLCYSYLRDFYQQNDSPPQNLLTRATESPNLEVCPSPPHSIQCPPLLNSSLI